MQTRITIRPPTLPRVIPAILGPDNPSLPVAGVCEAGDEERTLLADETLLVVWMLIPLSERLLADVILFLKFGVSVGSLGPSKDAVFPAESVPRLGRPLPLVTEVLLDDVVALEGGVADLD
jgi:hypothetical protein